MQPAENLAKVPDAALWVADALHRDGEELTVAVPEALSPYIRQIDSGFYMPYGRSLTALGTEISKESPNPTVVMTGTGGADCDYVVIKDSPENRAFTTTPSGWS